MKKTGKLNANGGGGVYGKGGSRVVQFCRINRRKVVLHHGVHLLNSVVMMEELCKRNGFLTNWHMPGRRGSR